MSTGTKIVQNALQKIGAHTKLKPANSTSLNNGMDKLNSMISEWQDDQIQMGAVPLEVIGESLSEPQGATNAIEDNLAILLQPDHPGSQISPQLRINATVGMAKIKRKYKTTTIPKQVVRETLPKGEGNRHHYNGYDRVFFDKGETIG